MRIVTKKSLEDCFAESLTSEIGLDGPITEKFIRHLGTEGELQYFPNFAKPFFRVDAQARYSISGIQGNNYLRVVLCHDNKESNISRLAQLINDFIE